MNDNFPRPNLPEMPSRIARLPVFRGFPVPWFVHWFHRDGVAFESPDLPISEGDYPDFRVTDGRRMQMAVRQNRCWVCGDLLGKHLAFNVGPMCAINRTSGEPPSHRGCAVFSSQACPFLSRPHMVRREGALPEGVKVRPDMLPRNPEVAMVWMTTSYQVYQDAAGVLFFFGEPSEYFSSVKAARPLEKRSCTRLIQVCLNCRRSPKTKAKMRCSRCLNVTRPQSNWWRPAREAADALHCGFPGLPRDVLAGLVHARPGPLILLLMVGWCAWVTFWAILCNQQFTVDFWATGLGLVVIVASWRY